MPYLITLYNDIKQFGVLLVSGGVLEQPAWLWQIVKSSGIIYENKLAEMQEEREIEAAAAAAIQKTVKDGLMKKYEAKG